MRMQYFLNSLRSSGLIFVCISSDTKNQDIFRYKRIQMSSDLFYKQLHTLGERLKALRNSLNMSRKEFAEKYGLSEYTFKISRALYKTVNSNSDSKFIQSFAAEGFECSEEWIMKGEGSVIVKDKKNLSSSLPENHILLEIELFQKHVPHSVVLQIDDESMSPIYKKQDYVGGVKLPSNVKTF